MTVKNALIAVVCIPSVSDFTLEKALIDAGLTPADEYNSEKSQAVDLAAISVLRGALQTKSVSEGGFSITFDSEAAKTNILILAGRYPGEPIADEMLALYGEANGISSSSVW